MDSEKQEPPRAPIVLPLRSQTTLRTLFVTTAVFAVLSALWTFSGPYSLLRFLLTPCAIAFATGLLGLSMLVGFVIGFATILTLDAFRIASESSFVMSTEGIIREAIAHAIPVSLVGVLWLTAWWWGLYLRYAWSNVGSWPPKLKDEATGSEIGAEWSVRDRIMAGCATSPLGFLIISLVFSISLSVFGLSLISEVKY